MLKFESYLTLSDALLVSIVSIVTVFVILAFIAVIISAIGKFMQKEKPVTPQVAPTKTVQITQVEKVNLDEIKNDEYKLVATIVASIEANKNDEDVKYRIVKIKEL